MLSSYEVSVQRPHVDEIVAVIGEDPRVSIVEGLRWRGQARENIAWRTAHGDAPLEVLLFSMRTTFRV